jgi:anti-sigma-K factor RskA
MLNENHVFDMLPAYALGSLEADEARQVSDHLAGCYSCRQELAAYQQVADGLLVAVPDAMPSAALKSRLMQRVQRPEPKRMTPPAAVRPPRRLSFAGAFAALALIVVLAASNLFLWQRLNHPEYMSGPLGMKAVPLQNTDAASDGSAFVIVSGDGENGVIVVDHLPPLDADHEYQVWLVRAGEITGAGTFAVDEDGYRGMRLSAPDSLLSYESVFVTTEPAGGSEKPTGAKVLNGSLFNK